MTLSPAKRFGALSLAAMLAIAACSSGGGASASPSGAPSAGPSAASSEPSTAPAVSGSISVSGSSTVEPISAGVAELLKESNPDFDYTVEGPGTGDGFKRFCNNEIDISDASRAIKDEEKAICDEKGIEFIELKIAIDGISVLTSPENTAVECLTFNDLYALIGEESQGFKKWSDAQALATELGSKTTFPDAELDIYGPGEESGTYDSFIELALTKIATGRGKEGKSTRADYNSSPNDNAIIEGIGDSPSSLGWVGFAFAEENKDTVRELAVDKGDGTCVAPTAGTIADGTYPLSRSLYIYVNKAKAESNAAVAGYVDFYLADGTIAKVLETVPYVNLTADELAKTQELWAAR